MQATATTHTSTTTYPITIHPQMRKKDAKEVTGGLTYTTKMPAGSYSLPTVACITGFKMAKMPGSICADCYANKGNYHMYANNIEPAQHARLASIEEEHWVGAMALLILADEHKEPYFRWHDSGDLQSVEHLVKIAQVCALTPDTMHWLPTREYGIVKDYLAAGHKLPPNLNIRLSAMYIDMPVVLPASLRGIPGITVSNVHAGATKKTQASPPIGERCTAPDRGGKCGPCRACWDPTVPAVSYENH